MKLMKTLGLVLLIGLLAATGSACDKKEESPAPAAPAAPTIQGVDDLTGKRIGVQTGTTGDIYAEDIEGATIERFSKGTDAVIALQQGKVDAVIIDDQPAKAFAALNADITVLAEPFTVEEYALCVAKTQPELTAAMNTAIAELKSNGTLQAITDYYIGQLAGAAPYSTPEGTEYPNGPLIMVTNAFFPPYESWIDGEVRGLDVDFVRAICDQLGYQLQVEDMDFDALITAVQSGRADFAAAGMTVTEDRLKNVDFTDTYCTASQVVIIKK
jgi:polar amino acid transport system substrate-binding protein